MRRVVQAAPCAALLVAFGLSGCKYIPPKPMKFNNMIARGNEKLVEAAKKFKEAVEPVGRNQGGDLSAARGAANEADKVVNDLTKEFDNLTAPKHGDALLSKYRDFLKKQRQIVDECMKPIVTIMEDNKTYPEPSDKWPKIRPLLESARKIEQDAYAALDTAQSEFCARKDYNFERKE